MNLLGIHIPCWLIPLIVGILCAILGYLLGRLFRKGNNNEEINTWRSKVSQLEADLKACNAGVKKGNKNNKDIDVWRDKVSKLEADLKSCNGRVEKANNNNKDIDVWKNKVTKLEADLNACNGHKLSLESSLKAAESKSSNAISSFATGAAVSSIAFNADGAKAVFGKKIKQDDLKIVEGIGPKIEGLFHSFDIKTWKQLSETSIEKCQQVLDSGGDRYKIHKPTTWPKQAALAYEGKWKELLEWQDQLDGGK